MLAKSSVQKVQIFEDDPTKIGEQTVLIDLRENWINVTHCDLELSMSLINWYQLVQLVECTKAKSKIK